MTVSREHPQSGSKSLLKSALNLKTKTFAMNTSKHGIGCSCVYLCIKTKLLVSELQRDMNHDSVVPALPRRRVGRTALEVEAEDLREGGGRVGATA